MEEYFQIKGECFKHSDEILESKKSLDRDEVMDWYYQHKNLLRHSWLELNDQYVTSLHVLETAFTKGVMKWKQ